MGQLLEESRAVHLHSQSMGASSLLWADEGAFLFSGQCKSNSPLLVHLTWSSYFMLPSCFIKSRKKVSGEPTLVGSLGSQFSNKGSWKHSRVMSSVPGITHLTTKFQDGIPWSSTLSDRMNSAAALCSFKEQLPFCQTVDVSTNGVPPKLAVSQLTIWRYLVVPSFTHLGTLRLKAPKVSSRLSKIRSLQHPARHGNSGDGMILCSSKEPRYNRCFMA